jgi:hypothetical protein
MKKIAWIIVAVLCLGACAEKSPDPVAQAIVAEMTKGIDQPCDIKVENLRKVDSTDFATEFKRRIEIYGIRLDQNTVRFEKYIKEGKKNNASKVFKELTHDTKVFNELVAMKEMMGDDTLKTAYYDYSFTYGGKIGNQKVTPKSAFATVTPDGRVLTYSADIKDLHKATGIVIPGYQELLDSLKEDSGE